VGPLLVPGRSKYASTSPARRFSVRPSVMTSVGAAGTPALIASISACMSCFPWKPSGHAVGGDDALVDSPGRFDFGVIVRNKQGLQPVFLLVGKQIPAGVQGPPGGVERVPGPSAVRDGVLLHALTAPVQGIAGKPNDVKRVHDLDGVRQLLRGCGWMEYSAQAARTQTGERIEYRC